MTWKTLFPYGIAFFKSRHFDKDGFADTFIARLIVDVVEIFLEVKLYKAKIQLPFFAHGCNDPFSLPSPLSSTIKFQTMNSWANALRLSKFNFSFCLLFNRFENLRSPIKNSFYSLEIGKDSLSYYKKWSCSFSLPYSLLLFSFTNTVKFLNLHYTRLSSFEIVFN